MLKKMIRKVAAALLISSLLFTAGCAGNPASEENSPTQESGRINIYEGMQTTLKKDPIKTFIEKEDVEKIKNALKPAEKIPGVLDVAALDYTVEMIRVPDGLKSRSGILFLWLTKDTEQAMIIYEQDSGAGYKLSAQNTQVLKQMLAVIKE